MTTLARSQPPEPRGTRIVPPGLPSDAAPPRRHWARDLLPTLISLSIHASLLGAIFYLNASTPTDADRVSLGEVDINPSVETLRPVTAPLDRPPIDRSDPNDEPPTHSNITPAPPVPSPAVRPTELTGITSELDTDAPNLTSSIVSSAAPGSTGAISAIGPGSQSFASFAGLRSKAANRIVYVVDASGAMASSFSFVQDRLKRSIDRLAPTQHFQVVLFGDRRDRAEGTPPYQLLSPRDTKPQLLRATPNAQQLAARWIDAVIPGGRSNPADGLRAAFALEPDLIFLLSRSIQRSGPNASWGRGKDAILAELEELNPASRHTGRRRVVIKTIQFLDEDPTGIMKAIAFAHGDGEGSYRLLEWDDLNDSPDEAEQMALAQALTEDESARLQLAADRLASVEADGAALSVLYGVPLPEQSDSVRRAADFTLSLLASIKSEGATDPRSPTDARLPLLRARAAILLASLTEDAPYRRSLAETAIASIEHLSLTDSDAEAARRVAHGVALTLAGEPLDGRRVLLSLVREGLALRASATIVAEARLGLLLTAITPAERVAAVDALRQAMDEEPFVVDRIPDPLWRLVAAEGIARAHLPEPQLAPRALDDLLALASDPELIRDAGARRALVYSKIAVATEPHARQIDWSQEPAEAAFARAAILARSASSWGQALELFGQVADRDDAGPLRADALWEAAIILRVQNTGESRARATILLERLAREFPGSARAPDALAAAVADAAGGAPELSDDFQLDVLRLGVERYADHPQADLWRVKYAERIVPRERLDILEPVTPGTPEGAAGASLYLSTVDSLISATPAPSETERLELLRRAVRYAERHDVRPRAPLLVRLGEAELSAGDPGRAMPLFVRAAARNEAIEGGADRLDINRARAHLVVGQDVEAFTLLREVAARLDAAGDRSDRFWQAWTIMLEVLALRAEAGLPGAGDARTHFARLRLIDANLGGEPWRSRINAARDRLDSAP